MTADEFLAGPAEPGRELVNGIVREGPAPDAGHERIALTLGSCLMRHARAGDFGRVTRNGARVPTGLDTVRVADVVFFARDRPPARVPDLVVEVKPSSRKGIDVLERVVDYLNAGVGAFVIVFPSDKSVAVYSDDGVRAYRAGRDLVIPEVLPGLSVPVASLFT
jgi:Uma2 family endonuclease